MLAGAGLTAHRPQTRLPAKLAPAGGNAYADNGDGPEKLVLLGRSQPVSAFWSHGHTFVQNIALWHPGYLLPPPIDVVQCLNVQSCCLCHVMSSPVHHLIPGRVCISCIVMSGDGGQVDAGAAIANGSGFSFPAAKPSAAAGSPAVMKPPLFPVPQKQGAVADAAGTGANTSEVCMRSAIRLYAKVFLVLPSL